MNLNPTNLKRFDKRELINTMSSVTVMVIIMMVTLVTIESNIQTFTPVKFCCVFKHTLLLLHKLPFFCPIINFASRKMLTTQKYLGQELCANDICTL
jgi:hypothetical protein